MLAANKAPEEIVTVGLYYTEADANNAEKCQRFIDDQIKQIEHIRTHLTAAANRAGATPPKFIVSVLLVPDWEIPGNSYTDQVYRRTHKAFFEMFARNAQDKFELQDAYQNVSTRKEKEALHQLTNNGANLDWVKTYAIIRNAKAKHLQLDSNTQISDYDSFYKHTFGQDDHDALNAINYADSQYIAPHNKVVYTVPGGRIAENLKEAFSRYYARGYMPKNKNTIYVEVFCQATEQAGLTSRKEKISRAWPPFFLADRLWADEYMLTKDIVSATNMSWSSDKTSDFYQDLKDIPPLKFNGIELTFPCFINLVNAHTKAFAWNGHENARVFREDLHDFRKDLNMMAAYYNHVKAYQATHPVKAREMSLLEQLESFIPNIGRVALRSIICREAQELAQTQQQVPISEPLLERHRTFAELFKNQQRKATEQGWQVSEGTRDREHHKNRSGDAVDLKPAGIYPVHPKKKV